MARELATQGSRRFALTLLEELAVSFAAGDEPLLARLYDEVIVGGQVYKTTRRDRFRELDDLLVPEIATRFAADVPVAIHDTGASNGITSLDFYTAVNRRCRATVRATDHFDSLFLVRLPGRRFTVVFDAEHQPLQIVGRRFVLSPLEGESKRSPLNGLLLAWLRRTLVPQAVALLAAAEASAGPAGAGREPATVRRLPLWHPECLQTAARDPGFTLGRHDVFVPTAERFQVIRVLNVLNPGYFDEAQVARAVRGVGAGLVEGGLLVVGRTLEDEGGRTRATVFLRRGETLTALWDLHGGAENRAVILAAGQGLAA